MEQTLDLAKLTLGKLAGEHFLPVQADESVAQVVDKLRDHQCAAAIFQEGGSWRVLSAELLPQLLLQGPETLQQPVSAVAKPLVTLTAQDNLAGLHELLGSHVWVGVVSGETVSKMLNWTSWARFTAQNRVAAPYLFSPEWGSNLKSNLAKV